MNTELLTTQPLISPSLAARTVGESAYSPPKALQPIDLRLDANEGPALDPDVAMRLLAESISDLRPYPGAGRLEELLARRFGVEASRVIVTAGADDALARFCMSVMEPGAEAVMTTPTFEMIPRDVRIAGGKSIEVVWVDGAFPVREVIGKITAHTRVVFVVSPNNPTGCVCTLEDVQMIRTAAPHVFIAFDGAYTEFADVDMTTALLTMPNVVVFRTFSKAYGLAGLRVGYAVASPGSERVVQAMRAMGQPYAVSGVSLAIAETALLNHQSRLQETTRLARQERAALFELLKSLGAEPVESQANFVLARFKNAELVTSQLASLGIAVRRFVNKPVLEGMIRITCPCDVSGKGYLRLEHALKAAIRPEALLFDMDGVIVDVSRSYREAIIQTAAHFGVTVTQTDIATIKASGNANNDWDVTYRLIHAVGKSTSFGQVKDYFEELYQGTATKAGLRKQEVVLIGTPLLMRLRARYRLGIVTGRPRADAERLLVENGLLDYFPTLICMEDAPLKPDPAPILLALKDMRAQQAWYLGDTVDDAHAARAAGVIPIGVIAPISERLEPSQSITRDELERDRLLQAGCARVLSSPTQIEDLLP